MKNYKLRLSEDKRLDGVARSTEKTFQSLAASTNDTAPDDIKEFLDIWKHGCFLQWPSGIRSCACQVAFHKRP